MGYNFDPVDPATSEAVTYSKDWGFNDSIALATPLQAVDGTNGATFVENGEIEWSTDADYYSFQSPASTPLPLTVTVTPAQTYGLFTQVTVYDANGDVVPSQVFANGSDGRLVIQVANPTPSAVYYLKVESVGRNGQGLTGDYTLSADFTQPPVTLSALASNDLTADQSTAYTTLSVARTKLYHFTLDATTTDDQTDSGMRMVIYDSNLNIVATLTTDAGTTSSGDILLGAGTYYVKFTAATKSGAALTNMTFNLATMVLSDPIDPYAPADPTSPPPPPTPDIVSSVPADPFYIGLPLTDPWANPWQ